MAVEYSYPLVQTVAVDENVLFLNGNRCCKKDLFSTTIVPESFALKV
jgi:hypothetical protein